MRRRHSSAYTSTVEAIAPGTDENGNQTSCSDGLGKGFLVYGNMSLTRASHGESLQTNGRHVFPKSLQSARSLPECWTVFDDPSGLTRSREKGGGSKETLGPPSHLHGLRPHTRTVVTKGLVTGGLHL
jgi:hypothetical protein